MVIAAVPSYAQEWFHTIRNTMVGHACGTPVLCKRVSRVLFPINLGYIEPPVEYGFLVPHILGVEVPSLAQAL